MHMIEDILKLNPDDVDRAFGGSILPEPGVYAATLIGVRDVIARSGLTGTELTFRISDGTYAGAEVRDTLWHSMHRKVEMRHALFAHRLGLTTVSQGRYQLAPGKRTFADCIGTPVLIDVRHDEYQRADGSTGRRAILSFEGILSPNDPKASKTQADDPTKKEPEEMF
jgi:hypothetical protein